MKKHKTIATVAAGLALSGVTGMGLSAVLASPAGAATPSALAAPSTAAPSTAAPSTAGHHPLRAWPRAHRKAVARDTIRISAKAIAVTPKDLVRALRSGQSIAEVAQAHNVDVQAVVNALVQAGDAQVGRAEPVQAGLDDDRQADVGAHHARGCGGDGVLVAGQALRAPVAAEDLSGDAETERGHPLVGQHRDR